MISRKLFENNDWLLTAGLFGRYKVLLKNRGLSKKATREEGHHFLRTLECMNDHGIKIEPNSKLFDDIAEQFCSACFGNGDARWQAHFLTPPHELAQAYAEETE